MRALRQMSIRCLISGHLQKLGKKIDIRRAEVRQWKNGVGKKIENKLRNTLEEIDSVI